MLVAWAVLCIIWGLLGWRSKRPAESAGNRFMSIHLLLMGSAFFFAFMSRRILPWRLWPDTPTIVWLGAALTCVGVAFASWSRVYLGTNWSGTPTIKVSHELVRRGPYALARHPIYSGIWLGLVGGAVGAGDVQALLAVALLSAAYIRKIAVEERQLRAHFGAAYEEYAKHVRAFIPFLV